MRRFLRALLIGRLVLPARIDADAVRTAKALSVLGQRRCIRRRRLVPLG
jgi:hypothetical protein